jgi:hypothetical protein
MEEFMVSLRETDESNWLNVINLKTAEDQRKYVAYSLGILARAYVYRMSRAFILVKSSFSCYVCSNRPAIPISA